MNNFGLTVLIYSSVLIAILLNLILTQIFIQLATKEEKKLNDENLGIKGNIMKLIYHNSKIPLTSSVLIGLLVGLAVYLGSFIKIRPSEIKSLN